MSYRIVFQGPAGWSWGDVRTLDEARRHAVRLIGTATQPGDAYGPVEIRERQGDSFTTVEVVRRKPADAKPVRVPIELGHPDPSDHKGLDNGMGRCGRCGLKLEDHPA